MSASISGQCKLTPPTKDLAVFSLRWAGFLEERKPDDGHANDPLIRQPSDVTLVRQEKMTYDEGHSKTRLFWYPPLF
jgi:hypothetical protein